MKYYLDRAEAGDFKTLVDLLPDSSFASPRRSTIPLLDYCRVPRDPLHALGRAADVDFRSPVELRFEYTVPVRRGVGKPSCTDLMIRTSDGLIAVEAKYTEPEYESVGEWLGDDPTPNRLEVLNGWLEMIGSFVKTTIAPQEVAELPYQLVHRTASACSGNGGTAAVVYLVFGDAADKYATSLGSLACRLGAASQIRIVLLACPVWKLDKQLELERRWIAGDRDLAPTVRQSLNAGPLFQFGPLRRVELISSSTIDSPIAQ